jgi:hypothetical protein
MQAARLGRARARAPHSVWTGGAWGAFPSGAICTSTGADGPGGRKNKNTHFAKEYQNKGFSITLAGYFWL